MVTHGEAHTLASLAFLQTAGILPILIGSTVRGFKSNINKICKCIEVEGTRTINQFMTISDKFFYIFSIWEASQAVLVRTLHMIPGQMVDRLRAGTTPVCVTGCYSMKSSKDPHEQCRKLRATGDLLQSARTPLPIFKSTMLMLTFSSCTPRLQVFVSR